MTKPKLELAPGEIHPRDTRYLTAHQRRYYDFIRAYQLKHDVSPSQAEIADFMEVCTSTVGRVLSKLVERGVIFRHPGQRRAIVVRKLEFTEIRPYKIGYAGRASHKKPKDNPSL